MKNLLKKLIVAAMEQQVTRLQRKNTFKVIAVVGSIGKTSTKLAIARSLSVKHAVRFQEGNYNDTVTVPLVFFGHKNPESLTSIVAWLKILISNEKQLAQDYAFEYVIIELGTDGPGQLKKFANYLQSDYTVVTAITPEHMEFFEDLNAVAAEELSVLEFSKQALVNADLCDEKYLATYASAITQYGTTETSDYKITIDNDARSFSVVHGADEIVSSKYKILQLPKLYSVAAAITLLHKLELTSDEITEAAHVAMSQQVPGRLAILEGIRNSTIIDDTYNASPEAVKFAIDILAQTEAPQKIAILGSMNELGKSSADSHREVGEYCNPKELDLLVTIGTAASEDLADAAEKKGCSVQRFTSPYEAGEFVRDQVHEGASILAKGSQNGVFAEEALKYLLKNKADESHLVRQSKHWLDKKQQQFGRQA